MIAQPGHIGDHQRGRLGARHRRSVMDHDIDRRGQRIGKAQHIIGQGIADQDNIRPGLVRNRRHRSVIGRNHPQLGTGLARLHSLNSHFIPRHILLPFA